MAYDKNCRKWHKENSSYGVIHTLRYFNKEEDPDVIEVYGACCEDTANNCWAALLLPFHHEGQYYARPDKAAHKVKCASLEEAKKKVERYVMVCMLQGPITDDN